MERGLWRDLNSGRCKMALPIECFEEESPNPTEALIGEELEPVSILTAEEEQDLQDNAMSAAELCMELYEEIEIAYAETEYSCIESFSEKQSEDVVKRLGEQGFTMNIIRRWRLSMEKRLRKKNFKSSSI